MDRQIVLAVANVVLASLLCSLHHWVALAKNRGDYTPFSVSPSVSALTFDETHAYAPPAERFMTSGHVPAEVDNYERRTLSAGIPYVPDVVMGGMGRLLGSLEKSFIAADVIFPALLFWLLYLATSRLVQRTSFRLLIAWATLLIPWGPRTFFWLGYDSRLAAPDITRTPQPELSFTLLLTAALLSSQALKPSAKRSTVIASGLLSALVVYSYYFYTIAWGVALGLLIVLAIAWRNWLAVRRVSVIVALMVAGSVPFLWETYRGKVQGGQTYLLTRMGEFTHALRIFPLACFVIGIIYVGKFQKRLLSADEPDIRLTILTILLLSGLAGLNFQVLSGYDAQHAHFWNRLVLPIATFLLGCSLLAAVERSNWNRLRTVGVGVIVVTICILANAGLRQVFVGMRIADLQRESRPQIELLKWVAKNLPSGSVIGSVDPEMILMIPAMGANFNYVPAGLRSLTPTSEIDGRYYQLAFLLNMPATEVESAADIPYHHTDRSLLFLVLGYIGTPQTFARGYNETRSAVFDRNYRLDYVVTDSRKAVPAHLANNFAHARILHSNEKYEVIGLH
jgi:hypothetical protein